MVPQTKQALQQRWHHASFEVQGTVYQIQSLLGAGSHASVWLARGIFYPNPEITIKIAHEQSGICYERVQNEIWFLNELEEEHIPTLLGHGILEGFIWLAMPVYQPLSITYMHHGIRKCIHPGKMEPDGYPRLAKKLPLKLREHLAISILRDLSKTIAYIAGTSILHADINPSNIMEQRGIKIQQHYMLTDWGASALIYRYPETAFGSLHFSAPERLLGTAGIKSDLFSLGITVFYIITGMVPYTGESGELYYLSTVERDGIVPSTLAKPINSNLDKLVSDLIRHSQANRPEPEDVVRRAEKL